MKKISLIVVFLLCGCSNKLTCSYKTNYDDVIIKNKIVFDFKEDKFKQTDKMIFENSIEASKYYQEIEEYKDEYNLVLSDNKIISIINDTIKLDGDKEEIKKQYESYDYQCR